MVKIVNRFLSRRAGKPHDDRDYRDLRGPLADMLMSDLANLDNLTKALAGHRR